MVNFFICGQETHVMSFGSDLVQVNLQKYVPGGVQSITILESEHQTWFTTTVGVDSDPSCLVGKTYNLCQDAACITPFTDTSIARIDTNNIVITLNPFNTVDIYF